MVEIKNLKNIDYLKYKEHLISVRNSNIFNSIEWIKSISEYYYLEPIIICNYDENNDITASLPFIINHQNIISFPFTDYMNIISDSKEGYERIISGMKNFFVENKYKNLIIHNSFKDNEFYKTSTGVLHLNSLEDDFSLEKKKMKYNHKWGVKKAIKSGIHFEMSQSLEFLEDYFLLHLQTRKRQGVPCQSKEFFRGLYDNIISKNLGFIGLSFMNKKPIAGGVFLHFNKTITYKYGASDSDYWKLQPNNLMFYEVIRWAVENKFKIFDFGKTDLDNKGLRDFKSGWGATESDLYYSSIPEQGSGKFKKIILDYCVKPVIKYSPAKVCELTGKYFYKYNI